MIGVIAGDVIGSVHEHTLTKSTDFALFDPRCRFTDDTVLTVATAYAILSGTPYETAYRNFGREPLMQAMAALSMDGSSPTNPVHTTAGATAPPCESRQWALRSDNVEDVLHEAERSAAVTHNHVEGIKGAQATALGVFLARSGASKDGTCRARAPSLKRSWLSWIPAMWRTPLDSLCRSAAMLTRMSPSRAASLRPSMEACPRPRRRRLGAAASEVQIKLPNLQLHAVIHVVVENQIALGEGMVVNTLRRLQGEGLSRHDALHAIGSVLAEDLYELMQEGDASTAASYQRYLERLQTLTAKNWRAG